ncbi:MAG: DNA polymerase III subunit delta' [Alphaproteobacteria bacterium]|nr:DNA polymerase III subunit delta' [Alphaproteobacteria bacterium]
MAARLSSVDQNVPREQGLVAPDGLTRWPHPRNCFSLFGQKDAEDALLSAYRSGRMPHAWLLQGREGIGKATLAYRFARFVLSNPDPFSDKVRHAFNLDVDKDSPVARQISLEAHPDLHVLRQTYNSANKKFYTSITMDATSRALRFLTMTSGNGKWRVLIVDSADKMNRNSANALLKTLEEPAPSAFLFLISHTPGRLSSTIRSRCHKLRLKDMEIDNLMKAVFNAGYHKTPKENKKAISDRKALALLSQGSVRRFLTFFDKDQLDTWTELNKLLDQIPDLNNSSLHHLSEQFNKNGGQEDFTLAVECICNWMSAQLHDSNTEIKTNGRWSKPSEILKIAEAWESIHLLRRETEIFNFDRQQSFLKIFWLLADIFRQKK